jgi:hypothetical protein
VTAALDLLAGLAWYFMQLKIDVDTSVLYDMDYCGWQCVITDIVHVRVSSSSASGSSSADDAASCDDQDSANNELTANNDLASAHSSLAPLSSGSDSHRTLLSSFVFRHIAQDTLQSSSVNSSDTLDTRPSAVEPEDAIDSRRPTLNLSPQQVTPDACDVMDAQQSIPDAVDSRQSDAGVSSSADEPAVEICDIWT